jgi:hypothetical protein
LGTPIREGPSEDEADICLEESLQLLRSQSAGVVGTKEKEGGSPSPLLSRHSHSSRRSGEPVIGMPKLKKRLKRATSFHVQAKVGTTLCSPSSSPSLDYLQANKHSNSHRTPKTGT